MLESDSDPTDRRRTRRVGAVIALAVAAVLVAAAGPGASVPDPPHRLYGTVTDGDGDALAGATVEVVYDGRTVATATTNESGFYDVSVSDPDTDATDETLSLAVNGGSTGTTVTWESGASERRDLTGSAGGGSGTTTTTTTATTTQRTTTEDDSDGGSGGGGNGGGAGGDDGSDGGGFGDTSDRSDESSSDDPTTATTTERAVEDDDTKRTRSDAPTVGDEAPTETTPVTTEQATDSTGAGDESSDLPGGPIGTAVGGLALFLAGGVTFRYFSA
ncbi:carboxypeptidase-like regulatory domain-containing protein [Halorussus lipolyticus]|uniref:carboxypeptidase-like regulatory domain-containing protein n=1 Tax=Halorussus lipolyticus TaxID=3034024 RepID=UPI0023E81308|nr:carboxypeptidase-like regulatory domain-containing protein [Halorussus sp. DT80]